MHGWQGFVGDMQQCYGVDMACLTHTFQQEQQQYYLATSAWADVHPSQLQGPPVCIRSYDLLTLTQEELAAPLQVILPGPVLLHSMGCRVYWAAEFGVLPDVMAAQLGAMLGHAAWSALRAPCSRCTWLQGQYAQAGAALIWASKPDQSHTHRPAESAALVLSSTSGKANAELLVGVQADLNMEVLDSGNVNAFCGYFDVLFSGSPESPADFQVPLSTAPDPRGSTHWGQQLFALNPPISCGRGERQLGCTSSLRLVRFTRDGVHVCCSSTWSARGILCWLWGTSRAPISIWVCTLQPRALLSTQQASTCAAPLRCWC